MKAFLIHELEKHSLEFLHCSVMFWKQFIIKKKKKGFSKPDLCQILLALLNFLLLEVYAKFLWKV